MMFTDGKTITDLTPIRFYMIDVCSPTIFSWRCLVNCAGGRSFHNFSLLLPLRWWPGTLI